MTDKVAVKNKSTGAITYMWEVDAEEAVRYAASTYAVVPPAIIPPKNPGGKGF